MIQNIVESTLLYTLELSKLFLFCTLLFKIQLKNSTAAITASLGSILLFAILSIFTDILHSGIPLGIMPGSIIIFYMASRKQFYLVILAYILTCLVDTIVSAIVMFITHSTPEHMYYNFIQSFFTNSVSLILLLLFRFKRIHIASLLKNVPKTLILLFTIGCIALGNYIAVLQLLGFSDSDDFYKRLIILSLSILAIVFLITGFLLLSRQSQLTYLRRESELSQNLLAVQKDYYLSLLEKETETRKFRHDIQNHLTCLHALYREKDYSELGNYLSQLDISLQELKSDVTTGNKLVDAIAVNICRRHSQVQLEWKGLLPNELQISSMDLCTVFSNLLTNAFEAAEKIKPHSVHVSVKILESSLFLTITNSAASAPVVHRGEYQSTKEGKNHGFGIRNVIRCVEKNGGHFETFFENGLFTAEVILLDAIQLVSA